MEKVKRTEKGVNFSGYKGDEHTVLKCAYCGKEFKHFSSEYLYQDRKCIKCNGKYKYQTQTFCSYNCRSKFRKENARNHE